VVNGTKKWITGGFYADFFTTAVRTGGEGMGGISLLLIEKETPGINIRKMETQFDNSHNTTFITFDNVHVPVKNLIGEEGQGFLYIVHNFNHERFVIATSAARMARLCFEEAFKYALVRKTFGKTLVQHQLIRFKLAEMARQIESLQDFVERVAFQFSCGVPDHQMGGQCALLKVQASKTFEYCSREASQIFGGSSIVKEGKGKIVERLAREVRGM
jgi:alkylation response protein AidB-like acyl-CoA dehydrogenase